MKTKKVVKLSDYKQPIAGCMRCGGYKFLLHLDEKLVETEGMKALVGIECSDCSFVVPVSHDD